jgi:hypothetical protein
VYRHAAASQSETNGIAGPIVTSARKRRGRYRAAGRGQIARDEPMRILSFLYRVASNFAFLAVTYFSLNYIEKYQNRAVLAMLILLYAGMRSVTVLRSFQFFGRIERLEVESRRLLNVLGGAAGIMPNKQVVTEVSEQRHDGEIKAYIDLFFLAAVVILCVAKITTN